MSATDVDPRLGCRAKVERAKEHLAELDRELNAYIASDPYVFNIHGGADRTQQVILKSMKPIPLRWSAIIRDVLSNTRSALDHAITCAASLETNSFKKRKFPIYRDRADFEKLAFKNDWQGCARTKRFIRRLKPYDRGDDMGLHSNTLVLLNQFRNRDMHNLIIPVGAAGAHAVITPKPGHDEPFELVSEYSPLLKNGDIAASIYPLDPALLQHEFKTQLTFQIRLGDIDGVPHLPISASSILHHIVKVVDRIVGIAERRLFKGHASLAA